MATNYHAIQSLPTHVGHTQRRPGMAQAACHRKTWDMPWRGVCATLLQKDAFYVCRKEGHGKAGEFCVGVGGGAKAIGRGQKGKARCVETKERCAEGKGGNGGGSVRPKCLAGREGRRFCPRQNTCLSQKVNRTMPPVQYMSLGRVGMCMQEGGVLMAWVCSSPPPPPRALPFPMPCLPPLLLPPPSSRREAVSPSLPAAVRVAFFIDGIIQPDTCCEVRQRQKGSSRREVSSSLLSLAVLEAGVTRAGWKLSEEASKCLPPIVSVSFRGLPIFASPAFCFSPAFLTMPLLLPLFSRCCQLPQLPLSLIEACCC